MRFTAKRKLKLSMLISLFAVLTSCALLLGLAQAQETTLNGKTYVFSNGRWYQVFQSKRFEVMANVISVKFKSDVEPDRIAAFIAQMGGRVIRSNRLGIHDIEIPEGADPLEMVKAYQAGGLVEFAEPNTYGEYLITPNDTLFNNQWGLHNTGQTGGTADADMDGPEAWDLETGSSTVVIAVLDSGTEIDHDDLVSNMWKNTDEIPGNGIDDDVNGFIDDYDGWDFGNNDNDPRGPFYHGTHVAGIVSAMTNNGLGVAGVAGGWSPGNPGCLIMPLGVGDAAPDGSILDDAILYAVDNGAHVITLSLSVGQSSAINAALEDAWTNGLFIDCASGNDFGAVSYPASHTRVMAVGATDHHDNRAFFSNFGPELEVVAPGVNIWSTRLANTYGTGDGTSYAAPQVAGLAGLLISQNPGMSNADIRQRILDTAEDQVGNPSEDAPGRDDFYGHGRINLFLALNVSEFCEEDDSGVLDIAGISGGPGVTVTVPVKIQSATNLVNSLGFEVTYNTAILDYVGYSRGECVTNFDYFDVNEKQNGLLVVGGFEAGPDVIPQGANCVVVYLEFEVLCDEPGTIYPLAELQNLVDDLAGWPASGACFKCGGCDVNGDGQVTPQDALCAFQKYLGIDPTDCGPADQIFCDVNGDGQCTPADALEIFKEYLGIYPNVCSP